MMSEPTFSNAFSRKYIAVDSNENKEMKILVSFSAESPITWFQILEKSL